MLPELIKDDVDEEDDEDKDCKLLEENCCKVILTLSNKIGSTD